MLRLVLPRVAVVAATLAFSRQIIENRLNQSHRNLLIHRVFDQPKSEANR
jgi:hypothetical protein